MQAKAATSADAFRLEEETTNEKAAAPVDYWKRHNPAPGVDGNRTSIHIVQ
jgi:hypothetical protein